jgi:hypothetical protein
MSDLAREAAAKLSDEEFNTLVREVILEFLRSTEGRALIKEIRDGRRGE